MIFSIVPVTAIKISPCNPNFETWKNQVKFVLSWEFLKNKLKWTDSSSKCNNDDLSPHKFHEKMQNSYSPSNVIVFDSKFPEIMSKIRAPPHWTGEARMEFVPTRECSVV